MQLSKFLAQKNNVTDDKLLEFTKICEEADQNSLSRESAEWSDFVSWVGHALKDETTEPYRRMKYVLLSNEAIKRLFKSNTIDDQVVDIYSILFTHRDWDVIAMYIPISEEFLVSFEKIAEHMALQALYIPVYNVWRSQCLINYATSRNLTASASSPVHQFLLLVDQVRAYESLLEEELEASE